MRKARPSSMDQTARISLRYPNLSNSRRTENPQSRQSRRNHAPNPVIAAPSSAANRDIGPAGATRKRKKPEAKRINAAPAKTTAACDSLSSNPNCQRTDRKTPSPPTAAEPKP